MRTSDPSVLALEQNISTLQRDLDAANSCINQFKVQIQELTERSDIPSDFAAFKREIDLWKMHVESDIEGLKAQLSKISKEHIQNVLLISKASKDVQDLRTYVDVEYKDHYTEHSLLRDHVDSSLSRTQLDIADTKLDIKKLADEVKEKLKTIPASVTSDNESLLKKVQIASLDAANSMLKVTNTDTNLRILERKLENVHLLLKKLDLKRQEEVLNS